MESADPSKLKFHERNYRRHPDDQIAHIERSIRERGFYRPVVLARGDVILAGHGVVKAALRMRVKSVPVIRTRLNPDSRAALKLMAGDNEMSRLAEVDDRALTQILKEVMQTEPDNLLGTGFDARQLAAWSPARGDLWGSRMKLNPLKCPNCGYLCKPNKPLSPRAKQLEKERIEKAVKKVKDKWAGSLALIDDVGRARYQREIEHAKLRLPDRKKVEAHILEQHVEKRLLCSHCYKTLWGPIRKIDPEPLIHNLLCVKCFKKAEDAVKRHRAENPHCVIPACNESPKTDRMCKSHYGRARYWIKRCKLNREFFQQRPELLTYPLEDLRQILRVYCS